MEHIDNANLVKIGIVVPDIEQAARYYCKLFGLPMPTIQNPDPNSPYEPDANHYNEYRGQSLPTRTKFCNLQMGPVTVELLEPLDEPSPWSEFKQKHGSGVHFIAYNVNGFAEHIAFMEQQGMSLVHKGEYGSGRYSYYDTEKQLGVTLGLQEMGPKK